MLSTFQCLRTRSQIKEIKKLDTNDIAIGTSLHGVKIFDYDTCDNVTSITHEQLNATTSAISFSSNAEFMAFSNASYIYVLHLPSKIVLKTIKADGENIEKLSFDLESKYIIASTQSGRVLQYRYDGSSLIGRLYSFEKSASGVSSKASAFAFYQDTMACASNNGTIFYINLHSRANKIILNNNNRKINSLCFLDENYIISGDEKGDLHLNYLKNTSQIKKQETLFTNIRQILLMPNKKYLMVSGDSNYVAIYNAKTLKLLHSKYIEFEDTPNQIIIADKDTLIATLENNSVEKIILPNTDKLKSFILTKELDKAYRLVEKDPLLRDTREFKILEITYNKIYAAALDALVKQNRDTALKLTSIFKYIDEKQVHLQLLFKAFDNYPRFKTLYAEKKYALAYAMSNKFPPLMQTFQYSKMEEIWDDTFLNAQRQIAHGKKENALALLKQFSTIVEKRPIIKLVLNHHDEFSQFSKAVQVKDYKAIAKITKENVLFTLIPQYKSIEDEMQISINSIQRNIHKCELESAVKQLSKLQSIDSIAQEISLQKDECIALKKLQDAYKLNDFNKCFETIDKNHSLNSTQLGSLLQKHWLKVISECEIFALKGNVKEIKESLGELIKLKTRKDKIGDLFRLAFHTKIKGLIHKKLYKKSEAIIYSYIDIFGTDIEILSIMKLYEVKSKTTLAITQGSRSDRDKWLNSSLIME